jgi:hypothetical protein
MPYVKCGSCHHELEIIEEELTKFRCDWCGGNKYTILEDQTPLEKFCEKLEEEGWLMGPKREVQFGFFKKNMFRMKSFLETKIKEILESSVLLGILLLIAIWVMCLIPIWITCLALWFVAPETFWQGFAIIALAVVILGVPQFYLTIVGIVCTFIFGAVLFERD